MVHLSEYVALGLDNVRKSSDHARRSKACGRRYLRWHQKTACPALAMNTKARCAARFHSRDMGVKNFFSHTGPNGQNFSQRMDNAGYSPSSRAENIATGQTTPAGVVASWISSTGHCNNIMNGTYKNLGVGYYPSPNATDKHQWTQKFGNGF
ncbi:MAG: CAP domain-containing protein [Byssovorax sp.]